MNEVIEKKISLDEFMAQVNQKVAERLDPRVPSISRHDAEFYHELLALSVETTVEEHVSYWQIYG